MKQKLSKFIQPAIAVLALVLIVSAASAWTQPTQAPTGGNVWAPLNTGPNSQTKQGNLWSDGSIFAGGILAAGDSAFITNFLSAAKGRFGCPNVFGCSGDTASNVLNAGFHSDITNTMTKGIAVDLDGSFYVKDGNQAAAKVLTSDVNGKGTWQALPAAPVAPVVPKLEVYKTNPSCESYTPYGGTATFNDSCLSVRCSTVYGTTSETGYMACWPVDGNHNLITTDPFPASQWSGLAYHPTPPYHCSGNNLVSYGIPTVSQAQICYNQKLGYVTTQ